VSDQTDQPGRPGEPGPTHRTDGADRTGDPVRDLFGVAGRTAVVTGGSRGIGFMIADALVRAGVEVVVSARKAGPCQEAADRLAEHGVAHSVPADLSTEAGARTLAGEVRERFGALNLLVNNAGASWGAPLEEFPDGGWDKVIDTNVRGVFRLTTALLPELRKAATPGDPARVVNVGSIDGLRVPDMENYSYSASKAAVHMLTRHLAKRLAGESITVNAIAPGPFQSKMTAFFLDDPESRAAVARTVPLGRIGEPDDVAGVTIFLASRAGAYLTGVVIPVDGGITGAG
jgi:NAD(P)-dependent dehydrogenase (short-subunit alcohol dehydrogenase family)